MPIGGANYLGDTTVLGSGAIGSGDIQTGGVHSGNIASGQVGSVHLEDGTVVTVDLGSGSVVSGVIASGQVGRFHVASGQFAGFELGSGSIVSGRIASGQVGGNHLASGGLQGAKVAGVASQIASGTVDFADLADASVGSGTVASGQISWPHLASGARVAQAQFISPLASGSPWTILTEEAVSGIRAVAISQSGTLRIAMAAVSGRMPAVGVVVDNVLSGIQANVVTAGPVQFTSGLADYSGFVGRRVWVGRSGQVTTISGSFSSGGFASGDLGQPLGVALWSSSGGISGAVLLTVSEVEWSGGPLGVAAGGQL